MLKLINLPTVIKNNLGNILTLVTLLGLAFNYLATKSDLNSVNTNVNMLRMELTIRVNENKLTALEKLPIKTTTQVREISFLTATNDRLSGKMEDIVNATN